MNKFVFFIYFLLVFISCKENEKTELNVSPAELNFTADAQEKQVAISSNTDNWTATVVSGQEWCTVTPKTGALMVYVADNTSVSRNAKINISGGGVEKTVSVTQQALVPSLSVSPDIFNINYSANDISMYVLSNVEFEIIIPQTAGWVSVKEIGAKDPATKMTRVTLHVTENTLTSTRSANITCKQKNGALSQLITINQEMQVASFSSISIQGNTYTTGGSTDPIDNNGRLSGWGNTSTVLSTYFKLSKTGNLVLGIRYSAGAKSKIKVTCNGKNFETECPAGDDQFVRIGEIDQVGQGYVKVDFQGIEKAGSYFPELTTLMVTGLAIEAIMYHVNNSDFFYWGRRGPSVHFNYTLPSGNVEWFYNEVTVPDGCDPVGSYFMLNGFSNGYFGIQVNSATERKILFSVWSPYATDDPNKIPPDEQVLLNQKDSRVISQAFGGEGSGRQNMLTYTWKTDALYKCLVRCRPDPTPGRSNYTEYTAYFKAPDEEWIMLASNSRPKTNTYYAGAHSFLENFAVTTGYLTRKVYFDNQWAYVKGTGWREVVQGRFTVDDTGAQKQRMDYKGGIENNKFVLQNCGFFDDNTNPNTSFTRTAKGVAPDIDFTSLPGYSE